jgi:hypothetical protein
MRYYIIMPYYKRPELRFSLKSYTIFYSGRNDVEIILIEDSKNAESAVHHEELFNTLKIHGGSLNIKVITDPVRSYNPSTKYNLGVKNASGDIIMLTNPETPHRTDILGVLDKEHPEDVYNVCSCLAMYLSKENQDLFNSEFQEHMWYQHSVHRNALYHFCTVLSKKNYLKIGGFDERYSNGIAYDDDNFVRRVLHGAIQMISRDDLLTYHIEHPRDYSISSEEYRRLWRINNALWASQLATGDF